MSSPNITTTTTTQPSLTSVKVEQDMTETEEPNSMTSTHGAVVRTDFEPIESIVKEEEEEFLQEEGEEYYFVDSQNSSNTMDECKHMVIEKVRQMDLLWDRLHDDHKDKDQRHQAWAGLGKDIQPPNKGVTAKETWEALNQAFNSVSNRRKKKSGGGQGDDKPWKFETYMSFFKAVKDERNTTSNLEETQDCLGDENSNSGMLEEAIFESRISNTNDDDENNLLPSKSLKPIPPKPSLKTMSFKRKGSYDAARGGLYKHMMQLREEKHKSPRLKFFESIMPQVDKMTGNCFLNFQIEVLNCLRHSRQHDPDPKRLNASCPMTPAI